ncbi:MAG: uracil-DNA glycosylase [Herbaspirillum sp.]|jgi:hypothetical protein|nr:uracil-DNA glycosylase [Herbaspirillum sp.]
MSMQFEPAAVARRMLVLDEIGVGPLWLRRDAIVGAPAPAPSDAPAMRPPAGKPMADAPHSRASVAPAADAAWHEDDASSAGAGTSTDLVLTLCVRTTGASGAEGAIATPYLFIARRSGAKGAEELFDNILRALEMKKEAHAPADLSDLDARIASHRPSALVVMDVDAARQICGDPAATLESLRGRIHRFDGRPALVTYPVAHLLRRPADKRQVWDDLCVLMTLQAGDVADPA